MIVKLGHSLEIKFQEYCMCNNIDYKKLDSILVSTTGLIIEHGTTVECITYDKLERIKL